MGVRIREEGVKGRRGVCSPSRAVIQFLFMVDGGAFQPGAMPSLFSEPTALAFSQGDFDGFRHPRDGTGSAQEQAPPGMRYEH